MASWVRIPEPALHLGAPKVSVLAVLRGRVSFGFGPRASPLPMTGIDITAADQGGPAVLISFLKAILDGRYRRGGVSVSAASDETGDGGAAPTPRGRPKRRKR